MVASFREDGDSTATETDAAEMIDFARDAIDSAQAILASGKLRPWT